MVRKYLLPLIFLGMTLIPLTSIAEENLWSIQGTGSRRGTNEIRLGATSAGSAAYLRPGTNDANDLGTSSYKWKDLYLSGDLSVGDDATITDDLNLTDDLLIGGDIKEGSSSTAMSTAATAGNSLGTIYYAYLGGVYDATEGCVLVATDPVSGQGLTVIRAAGSQDYTAWVGVAASAVSTGSVVGIYTSGFVLALTTGTVNPGDTLVVSDLGTSGYLEADTTPTTGADVGVACATGNPVGGLTRIRLR